jgi:starch synthase (maltosyl-transferring)
LAYSKFIEANHSPTGKADAILVVVNVDPHAVRETSVHLDLAKLGLPYDVNFEVTDLVTNQTYIWSASNFVKLDAFAEPVHIFSIGQVV